MSEGAAAGGVRIIRIAIILAGVGTLGCLALLIEETPYTFTAFMFLGQPCLALAFVLFVWQIAQDLRTHGVLG
jgi:hypothetical protein